MQDIGIVPADYAFVTSSDEFHRIGVGQLRGCCALQQLESRCGFRGAQPAVGVVGCSLRTMPLLSVSFALFPRLELVSLSLIFQSVL